MELISEIALKREIELSILSYSAYLSFGNSNYSIISQSENRFDKFKVESVRKSNIYDYIITNLDKSDKLIDFSIELFIKKQKNSEIETIPEQLTFNSGKY